VFIKEHYYTLYTTNFAALNIRKARSYTCTGLQRTKGKGKDHPRTGTNKLFINCNIQPYSDHLTLQILLVLLQFDAIKPVLVFPSFSTTSTIAQRVYNYLTL